MPITLNGTTGVVTPGATVGSITGILKASSGVVAQAVAGTDYLVGGGSAIPSTNTAKAWVNFNGTTSPGTIRSSYNVSSVTKNGTGDYTITFTTPMSDANYSVSCTGSGMGVQSVLICRFTLSQLTAPSTNSIRVAASNGSGANATDDPFYSVQIFGN